MRLIDADELRYDILNLLNNYNEFLDTYDKAQIIDIIDVQPTIEAEPIRHGGWVYEFGGYVYCSVCSASPLLDGERGYVETPFCPSCGAKMDKGET